MPVSSSESITINLDSHGKHVEFQHSNRAWKVSGNFAEYGGYLLFTEGEIQELIEALVEVNRDISSNNQ